MAYNKIIYKGDTLIDLTKDTVTPETLMKGATAHGKNGEPIVGIATGGAGGGGNLIEETFTANGTYEADLEGGVGIVEVTFDSSMTNADFEWQGALFFKQNYTVPSNMSIEEWVASASITIPGMESLPLEIETVGSSYLVLVDGAFPGFLIVNDINDFNDFGFTVPSTGIYLCNITLFEPDYIPELVYSFYSEREPFDGWNKITVKVEALMPPGEWGRYIAPDGLQFIYGFSEDGKDLYVMGTGALTSSDFYCTAVPWKKSEKIETVERVIIGSGITDYPWYAFPQESIVIKNQ